MNIRRFFPYIKAISIGLSAVSAALILYFILKYGVNVPYMDQWEFVGFFDHLAQGQLTFEELFRLGNEYRQFFPNLIFVGLGWLTHWNVRYEMIVIFLMACLVSFNVYRLAVCTLKGESWLRWTLFFLANLFIFSPMQFENWLFGVQIEYFLPIVCISSGLVIAFTRIDDRLKLLFCLLLSIISTYSSINGFLIWLVLYPVFYFSGNRNALFRKWTFVSIWLGATILALFFYFSGYQKPGAHPSMSIALHHPLDAIYYFCGTLGNTLRVIHDLKAILLVGGLMGVVFALELLYVIWYAKDKTLLHSAMSWIMLGMYSVMTSGMLMVGRMGFGSYQSLASRYTSFTLFVDVAMIFLAAVIFQHYARNGRKAVVFKIVLGLLAAFVVFTKVNTYGVAVDELKGFHARVKHGKAGLLFINFISHDFCQNKLYPDKPMELQRKANILDHFNLLNPPLVRTNLLQDIEGDGSGRDYYGNFDWAIDIQNHYFMATGSAVLPRTGGPADAILLSYDDAQGRPVLLSLDNEGKERWINFMYVGQLPSGILTLRAWAFDLETCKAYRLNGCRRIVVK